MDFASSSTMFDLKHFGGDVNIADKKQETIDDQWWKELTMFSTCDLEASQGKVFHGLIKIILFVIPV